MSWEDELDPFSQVYSALWDLAMASVPLAALIKVGNRIRFDSETDRSPTKSSVQVSDLPELQLNSDGTINVNMHNTSCTSLITRQYSWVLSTGDERLNKIANPAAFGIFAAMTGWQTALAALTWHGSPFVKKTDVINVQEGLSNRQYNRGIGGWVAVWRCSVEMHFLTSELGVYNNG